MNYNSLIKEKGTVKNYEGAKAYAMTPEMELYTAVVTCAMSDKYYEDNYREGGQPHLRPRKGG